MSMDAHSAYRLLIDHIRQTALLASTASVLNWDRETYMPPHGGHYRAEQLAYLSGLAHQRATDPKIGEWLTACENSAVTADPISAAAVNVREIRREYDKLIRVPQRLVEETTRTTSLAHQAWADSRSRSSFAIFEPWLDKIVVLKREYADAVGYEQCRYDALLDDYEPGQKTARLTPLFEQLSRELRPVIESAIGASAPDARQCLLGDYPVNGQQRLAREIAAAIGFDFDAGRLDTVVHPFCSRLGPDDVRITTRWDEHDLMVGLFGVLHETGHALYDQGLPQEHWGTPMGEAISLGIHESQSRLWENMVGRSPAFWERFLPIVTATFPKAMTGVSIAAAIRAINEVRPSFIRVEADEATYTMHIVLRFELEQQLIAGKLAVHDLPDAWNSLFEKLLGLSVPDDAHGCLQDVHWSAGLFGYFPTYALGNLYAAQLYHRAERDIPDLESLIRRGEFRPLLEWLKTAVHGHGKRYRADELIQRVTGESLKADYFVAYLRDKYSRLQS